MLSQRRSIWIYPLFSNIVQLRTFNSIVARSESPCVAKYAPHVYFKSHSVETSSSIAHFQTARCEVSGFILYFQILSSYELLIPSLLARKVLVLQNTLPIYFLNHTLLKQVYLSLTFRRLVLCLYCHTEPKAKYLYLSFIFKYCPATDF